MNSAILCSPCLQGLLGLYLYFYNKWNRILFSLWVLALFCSGPPTIFYFSGSTCLRYGPECIFKLIGWPRQTLYQFNNLAIFVFYCGVSCIIIVYNGATVNSFHWISRSFHEVKRPTYSMKRVMQFWCFGGWPHFRMALVSSHRWWFWATVSKSENLLKFCCFLENMEEVFDVYR